MTGKILKKIIHSFQNQVQTSGQLRVLFSIYVEFDFLTFSTSKAHSSANFDCKMLRLVSTYVKMIGTLSFFKLPN